ncbi:MAG: hypothetical protein V8R83_03830 [Candidatus Gastranaerophilaceae bacterium]
MILLQQKCAEFIKNRAQDYGITLKSNLLGAFNYVLNRWYDSSEQLAEAFDYLKMPMMKQENKLQSK